MRERPSHRSKQGNAEKKLEKLIPKEKKRILTQPMAANETIGVRNVVLTYNLNPMVRRRQGGGCKFTVSLYMSTWCDDSCQLDRIWNHLRDEPPGMLLIALTEVEGPTCFG